MGVSQTRGTPSHHPCLHPMSMETPKSLETCHVGNRPRRCIHLPAVQVGEVLVDGKPLCDWEAWAMWGRRCSKSWWLMMSSGITNHYRGLNGLNIGDSIWGDFNHHSPIIEDDTPQCIGGYNIPKPGNLCETNNISWNDRGVLNTAHVAPLG